MINANVTEDAIPIINPDGEWRVQVRPRRRSGFHRPRWDDADRNGTAEIFSTPSSGESSSRIRKIALDTESAQMSSATTTVVFAGANSPKLTNATVIQNTSI